MVKTGSARQVVVTTDRLERTDLQRNICRGMCPPSTSPPFPLHVYLVLYHKAQGSVKCEHE